MERISLFRQKNASEVFDNYLEIIKKEVSEKPNDYVLNIDYEEWLRYITDRFEQKPLIIYPERITTSFAGKGQRSVSGVWGPYEAETTRIDISLPFTGTSYLFYLQPSTYTLNSVKATVEARGNDSGIVTHTLELTEQNTEAFNASKQSFLAYVADNIPSINREAEIFNTKIRYTFSTSYEARKQKALSENTFFESIGIQINNDTESLYQSIAPAKKRVPEPQLDEAVPKKYTPNPSLDDAFYKDIINVIYTTYKSVEKKPSVYKVKDEEELRDYILPLLETRYESSTVTGETFNKGGKTDILVRYKDNSNLFVAECKYWKGESGFLETINQLFDRYLTWRDSKTALIFFVKNKEFSKVLTAIRDAVKKHPYFVRENGGRGESSFSYIFHFPTDTGKLVYTEVMAFHFPE
ncbi:hypothetical protein [Hymenobacter rigui]|uniref:Uncharacterized protein n=1 Tax=Hymenobacter rigui TaxID=334424 RepID=A0A428KU20_9BACT|nr:hypothetical protein [Hymenobacter rigui]RSK50119.1 hypothetical protein EI291_05560 [Hymenobacter rigui]